MSTRVLSLDERHFKAAEDKARELGTTPDKYVERLIDADVQTSNPAPTPNGAKGPKAGSAKGKVTIADDFDAPLDDFAEYR